MNDERTSWELESPVTGLYGMKKAPSSGAFEHSVRSLSRCERLHWKAVGNAAVAFRMELQALRQTLMVWLDLRSGDDGEGAKTKDGHHQAEGSNVHDSRRDGSLSGSGHADVSNALARRCNASEAAIGQIQHATTSVGAAIIDGHQHRLPIVTVLYKHF